MPKFVPVTDPERALAEQNSHDAEFAAHRMFDDPHTVKPVDRGWAQGQDGWGVLRKFGGEGRDDGAQVLRHGEGNAKMIRNSKGLWIRSKETESEVNRDSHRGMGRGNRGVPVLDMGRERMDYDEHLNSKKDSRQFHDQFDYKSKKDLHHSDNKSDRRAFDDHDSREQHQRTRDSSTKDRERGRTRDNSRDRYQKSSHRSDDRHYRSTSDRREDRHADHKRARNANADHRSRSRSRRRSESRGRTKDKRYARDNRRHRRRSRSSSSSSSSTSSSSSSSGSSSYSTSSHSRSRSRDNHHRHHRHSKDTDRYTRKRDSSSHRHHKVRSHSRDTRHTSLTANTTQQPTNISSKDRHSPDRSRSNQTSTASMSHPTQPKTRHTDHHDTTYNKDHLTVEGPNKEIPEKEDNKQEEEEDDNPMRITAVQVINRFHEVYSAESSKTRLVDLRELFAPTVTIASLCPYEDGVVTPVLSDRNAVLMAFLKTHPTPTSVSKRVYVELPLTWRKRKCGDGEDTAATRDTADGDITFVCDFHRRGTMPALGDGHRGHVLLYQVQAAAVTHIWGMEDTEQLSERDTLTFEELQQAAAGRVWSLVRTCVLSHAPVFQEVLRHSESVRHHQDTFETLFCHYHNYDQMEVWGLM